MSAPAAPTVTSLTAAVRQHLALSVRQLGRYLGVSAAFVAQLESGHRGLPPTLAPRLIQLSRLLPPPLGQGPPAPPAAALYDPLAPLPPPEQLSGEEATPAAAPKPLRRRLRDTRLLLLVLGQRLAAQQARAAALAHRQRGLAQLRAAPAPPAAPEAAHYARWLAGLATDLARDTPDPATTAATRRLLAARLTGLRAEVAALQATPEDPATM